MSADTVNVPRVTARMWVEARRVIQQEPSSKWAVRNCIRAEADLSSAIDAALAASTPVGCWERTDVQRLMHPVMGYLLDKNVGQRVAEEASERAVDAMYRALDAPHQPFVGGWNDIRTAPKDGSKFDAWDRDGRITDVYWSEIQDAFCTDGQYGPEEPSPVALVPALTHWRSIPAPPQPSVSIDNGPRPQEAVPTEQAEPAVVVPRDQLETLRRSLELGNLLTGEGETLINCWIFASEAESKA